MCWRFVKFLKENGGIFKLLHKDRSMCWRLSTFPKKSGSNYRLWQQYRFMEFGSVSKSLYSVRLMSWKFVKFPKESRSIFKLLHQQTSLIWRFIKFFMDLRNIPNLSHQARLMFCHFGDLSNPQGIWKHLQTLAVNQIDALEICQIPKAMWKHLQTFAQPDWCFGDLTNSPKNLGASSSSNFSTKSDQFAKDTGSIFKLSQENRSMCWRFLKFSKESGSICNLPHEHRSMCWRFVKFPNKAGRIFRFFKEDRSMFWRFLTFPIYLEASSEFCKKTDQCVGDFSESPRIGSIFRFLTDQCVRDFSNSPRNLEAYSVHCTLLTLDVSSKDNKILVVTVLDTPTIKKKSSTSIFSRCFRCPNDIRNSNYRASIFNYSNRGGACHVHTSIIRKIKIQRFSANNSIYPPEAHILTLFPNSTWTLVKLFNRALEFKKDGKSWDNYSSRAVWALVTAPKSICFLQNRFQLYEVAISWFWDFYWMATIPPPKYHLGRTEEPS